MVSNLREGMHHVEQLVGAPAALDVVTDAARLEIGDDHLVGIIGANEATVEVGDRKQLFVSDGDEDVRRDAVAPFRIGFRLFVHREAFGEPARHAMIGGGENEDVAHLVPQRAGPVKIAGLAAGRAVHGDHFAEGDAQRAQAGHAQRAHGKVFVVGIDLHLHRARQLHFVFLLVGGDGALQHFFEIGMQQIGFFLVELEDGGVVLEGYEILVAVEQAQAVDGGGVAIAVVVSTARAAGAAHPPGQGASG